MNVIKVYGGLGNQFFQYAFGQAMKENGIFVKYDLSWFDKASNFHRPYTLDKFYTSVPSGSFIKGNRTFDDVKMKYVVNMNYLVMDNCNFHGYWQHPCYFSSITGKLQESFRVKREFYTEEFVELRQQIICNESVSLHVRRGDYITVNGHYLLSKKYYEEALGLVKGQVYVFSDDIKWCKENFSKDFVYVDLEEYLCFDLMRCCSHNIIANSTFSWWAAYLNTNTDKVVVSPKQWRKDPNDPAWKDKDFRHLGNNWHEIDSPGIVT